ncbi:sugar phosphate isomerase/epimerase family protein [Roseibium limicola]|uniref:Sugar phosphate isomerase/epimerase n=1 Tax=Roseibium limicola TaxID=2816037 RepID=A0A939J848_9HYPH|nr:sugar phosphate isomerase/epimerase family protein [Roseibium limicola]MBO0346837.1 sugar phosphate isomerase/epimerase [Roseibium limicola]
MSNLPIVGAAMTLDALEAHRSLMLEQPRDLELQDFTSGEVLNRDWMPLVERARKLRDGQEGRLGIHGPFWGFSVATPDPDVREIVKKRLLQGLDVCEALGATHMVVHSPFTSWDNNNLDFFDPERKTMIELCHLTMADAVKRAEEIGCELVIENIEDKNPRERVILANSFNSEAVAVSIDTGHAHYAHGYTAAPPVDAYVLAAGNRLRHIHLQDADGYADRHWSLGRGTVNWHAVFDALNTLSSNPRLIIELRDLTQIPLSIKYLQDQGLAK